MSKRAEIIEGFTNDHFGHIHYLPKLKKAHRKIHDACAKLDITKTKKIKSNLVKSQCEFLSYSVSEFNQSIINSLENELYSPAEALSRIALEHSINTIWVLEGSGSDRAKRLIYDYLVSSKRKAIKWKKFSEDADMEYAVKSAEYKIQNMQSLQTFLSPMLGKKVKELPNARTRFHETGFEESYHTLFSTASDSVHSLSEDVVNKLIGDISEGDNDYFSFKNAEKVSFAYYLGTCALLFYAISSAKIANKMSNKEIQAELEKEITTIQSMIEDHEMTSRKYREQIAEETGNNIFK